MEEQFAWIPFSAGTDLILQWKNYIKFSADLIALRDPKSKESCWL